MKVQKLVHKTWKEVTEINDSLSADVSGGRHLDHVIGKFHYIYSAKKGTISLIELPNYFHNGVTLWETYCIKGDLFEDTPRFHSKPEAEIRIAQILGEPIPKVMKK